MYPSARRSFHLVCFACLAAVCLAYGPVPSPVQYVAPVPVKQGQGGEAQAEAFSNAASAAASAAKISAVNWEALNQYGLETGKPLLVTDFGVLTDLYDAGLPPSSFVAQLDPSFRRGPYNKIQHLTGSNLGVFVI